MDWEVRAVFLWLILGVLGTIQDGAAEKKVVCYYTNWSIYRPGTAKFSPQNINPYLCTHLIYAFGGFTKDNTLKPFDKYQDIEKGGYAKFTGLKTYNKNLKTMLAIGGWNEGSSRFSPMVADPARRRELVKNSIKFLRQNHFDGLDLDWEYPAFRDGGKPRDKDNYANLVQELREEFERESSKTGRPRLLLSMAMPAGIEYVDKGYDVPRLNDYLDFINLLSYDYHSAFEPAVNHHAPLYPLEEDNEYNFDSELTIDYTINHLIKSGASPEKIILGIPTYGRSYTLFNEDSTELGSPADGPGVEGDATREKGYLAYYEICESLIDSDDWEVVQPNPKAMGPYAFKGNQWVGYDDVDIVKLKARYVNEKNLGGIMFWSIDNDDFRGKCHNRPYPLIEAAKEALLIEDSRSTGHNTKRLNNRKKLRGQSTSSNTLTRRKVSSSNRRTTTTLAPVTRKQVASSKPNYRTISRTSYSEEEEEDRELDRRSYDPASIEEENDNDSRVKSSNKNTRKRLRNRNKSRGQSSNSRRKKPSRNEEANENDADVANEESLGNKLTTPEPPTTPDPGTDFKCEDEGFFSHPRDCKKYFWCLDSGPSGLGIVGHQFTCPSGLVFNKGADSCDYPRNVVCPKAKTPQSSPTTTRAPITAATSRTTYLHSTTQRTTTAKSDSEEEYEYYDDDDEELDDSEEEEEEDKLEPRITSTARPLQYKTINRSKPTVATTTTTTTPKPEKEEQDKSSDLADEEDPKVIKELINLIRKAGGIEELEKQLSIQEKGSSAASSNDPVTPATISRTLYERVLSRQAGKIITGNTSGSSEKGTYKNGPGRSQFEGLDEVPEVKSLRRTQKPQYVTIERPKVSTDAPAVEDEESDDEEELDDYNVNVASSEDETISNPSEISTSTQRVTPNYVNIRRNRLSTTTARNENDVEDKKEDDEERNPIRRYRPNGSNKNQDKEPEEASKPSRTRTRYRNPEEPSEPVNLEEKPTQKTRQTDESNTATTKSRYINIQRFRSTTPRLVDDSAKDKDDARAVEVTTEIPVIKTKVNVEQEITTTSTSPATSTTVESTTPFTIPTTTTTTPPTTFSQSTSSSVSSTLLYLPSSTSTSTEVTIRVEPTEDTSIPNILNDNVNSVSSTTDSVKLVEDSATEILLTTAPASSSPPSTSVLTSTRVVATVSQPRPFGFTRRRSGSVTPDVTTTPIAPSSERSRPKVANSDTPRLPTLKELIGYQTYDYTTTPSSVLFNLLSAIDINEDIGPLNRVGNEQNKELKKVFYNTNENPLDDDLDDIFVKHDTDTNDISNEFSISKRRKTRIDHDGSSTTTLKPTTMRGTPISSLTARSVTRGFYVTKGDIETTIATYTTPDELASTTEFSLENETTILPLDTSTGTESIPKKLSTKSVSTILQDTNETYSEQTSVSTELAQTTPLATTTNVVHETTKNADTSSINDVSFTKPTRKTRGRVRYTVGTSPLYGHRVRSRIRSTTEPNYSNIDVSSTSKNVIVSTEGSTTTRYEELQSSTNLMTDTIVSSTRNVERKTTPLDYTLQTESDTAIPETSTSMTTTFVVETIQPESSTVRSNIETTQETEDETDANEIISDKNDEYASTVIFNYATKHEIPTTTNGLTTPNFETTFEMTTPMKETESTETIKIEKTTMSYATTENKDIFYDITTTLPELASTIVPKSSPPIEQTTTFSETTQFPSTNLPNLSSSDNFATTQEIRGKDIPRQRQRFNNQFGQRTRAHGYRRIVQRKEIKDETSTQELNNSKPNRRHRVRVYRTRQRRPNLISSSTETNNFVSIDDTKPDNTEKQTRRLKLGDRRLKVNRNKYVEETIPTEQNSLRDTTQPTLVTEEYTERPVDEGTLSRGSGSSSGRTKPGTSILVNRLRNVNGSSQSLVTRPSTVLGDNRKSRPSGTSTVSPTATIVDAFEDATVSSPEQSVKDEDDRAEISDQNGRAQELAVTLADPPTSQSSSNTGRLPLRDTLRRRISTTVAPRTDSPRTSSTSSLRFSTVSRNRQRQTSTTRKEGTTRSSTSRPRRPTIIDYDYYEDEETPIVEKSMYNGKLYLTSKGTIKCLDQGNFPHPYSCKKFITCARIVNGLVVGAEYTCPDKLSFDPVGGICNWSAGLGCKE